MYYTQYGGIHSIETERASERKASGGTGTMGPPTGRSLGTRGRCRRFGACTYVSHIARLSHEIHSPDAERLGGGGAGFGGKWVPLSGRSPTDKCSSQTTPLRRRNRLSSSLTASTAASPPVAGVSARQTGVHIFRGSLNSLSPTSRANLVIIRVGQYRTRSASATSERALGRSRCRIELTTFDR